MMAKIIFVACSLLYVYHGGNRPVGNNNNYWNKTVFITTMVSFLE